MTEEENLLTESELAAKAAELEPERAAWLEGRTQRQRWAFMRPIYRLDWLKDGRYRRHLWIKAEPGVALRTWLACILNADDSEPYWIVRIARVIQKGIDPRTKAPAFGTPCRYMRDRDEKQFMETAASLLDGVGEDAANLVDAAGLPLGKQRMQTRILNHDSMLCAVKFNAEEVRLTDPRFLASVGSRLNLGGW